MDGWQGAQQHKRSYAEMSQQATLSPAHVHQRFSSAFRRSSSIPSGERRRFSHPHNPPHLAQGADNMTDRSHAVRPQLRHQTSQTLTIDLTDDTDDAPVISQTRVRSRPQAPPTLGRSDGQAANIIDLTSDNDAVEIEPEVEVTYTRQIPRRIPQPPPPRAGSPPLFMPAEPLPGFHARMGHFAHRININRLFSVGRDVDFNQGGPDGGDFHDFAFAAFGDHAVHFQVINAQINAAQQAMPGEMNYQRDAFADRKPDHVPPQPAREGFTRSPTENDTIICPSCEEELVHNKQKEGPVVKKGGKEPTKKEREEHPFWVLRECGHVYCNKCFQHRTPTRQQTFKASFIEAPPKNKKVKGLLCAVEGCESDVRNREKWVGVFL